MIDTYDTDENGVVTGKLKRCSGKRLEYLGMVLDFLVEGQVSFEMEDYVVKIVKEFEEFYGQVDVVSTPAPAHLFDTQEDCPKLEEKKAQMFHHMTAKALYICKRARPDIQTAVAFLSTRVKSPDEDD